jgi:hypothetical protein
LKAPKGSCTSSDSSSSYSGCTYASGTPSPAARKILDEKIATTSVKGTGKTEELLRMML